jgi:hypothetical protein
MIKKFVLQLAGGLRRLSAFYVVEIKQIYFCSQLFVVFHV